jgi:hypothetical protein
LTMTALLMLGTVFVAYAGEDHYYIGGYFVRDDVITATRAIMATNIISLDTSSIPSSDTLQAVLSVAGGTNGVPSGCIYQNPIEVLHDGRVIVVPQVWYGSTLRDYKIANTNVSTDAIAWYVEIRAPGNGTVDMWLYTYATWIEYEYNAPEKWHHAFSLSEPCENDKLLIGVKKHGDYYVKFLQFGIEASSHVGSSNNQWEIQTYEVAYYINDKWYYLPAKSVLASSSAITYIGSKIFIVGGKDYSGVNVDRDRSSDDYVFWKYTGSTLPSGSTLWDKSGNVTPYPYWQWPTSSTIELTGLSRENK